MKIKTNYTQLSGVVLLLDELLKINKPQDIAEKLVHGIVFKVFQKLRIKSETPGRSGYGITLSDQDALALFVFLNHVDLMTESYPFEAVLIQGISDEIHKNYV